MTRRIHSFVFMLLMLSIAVMSFQSLAEDQIFAYLKVQSPVNIRKTPDFGTKNNVIRTARPPETFTVVSTVNVRGFIHYEIKDSQGNTGYVFNDSKLVAPYVPTSQQPIPRTTLVPGSSSTVVPQARPVGSTPIRTGDVGLLMPTCGCTHARCRLVDTFGMRKKHPIYGDRRMHAGVDLGGPTGTPVYASADGIVTSDSGYSKSWGKMIVLRHDQTLKDNKGVTVSTNGFETQYNHLSRYIVKVGQRVSKGQLIGYMGATGRVTGPHLCYNVRANGRFLDPMRFFEPGAVRLSSEKVNTVAACPTGLGNQMASNGVSTRR